MEWLSFSEGVVQEGEVPSCMYLLGIMGAVVLALVGALIKVVKIAWDERQGRMTDRAEMNTELSLMLKAAQEKKGGPS